MSKGQSLPFIAPPLLVEEKAMKDFKVIRMQQIGNKKEYIIKFEVSLLVCFVLFIYIWLLFIAFCYCVENVSLQVKCSSIRSDILPTWSLQQPNSRTNCSQP